MLMSPKLIGQLESSLKNPPFTRSAPSKRPCLPIHTINNLDIDLKQAASSGIIANFLGAHYAHEEIHEKGKVRTLLLGVTYVVTIYLHTTKVAI